jgi:hypothetical protein
MVNQELIPLLTRCTVRISTPNGGFGTGFFIAPGWIITCAHVVKGVSSTVDILWRNIKNNEVEEKALIAEVKLTFAESSDIAFLKLTTDDKHPCVYIDPNHPQTDDLLYTFGYPAGFAEDYSAGDSITTRYEGESVSKNQGILLKLKQGQIKSGFSGSPLLNMRTGGVVGIVKATRDPGLDLGGRAVPISMIYPSPKLLNLSIADRKNILEIIEGNRKSNKYNKRWRSIAKWNKNIVKTASLIALLTLIGLAYLVISPPEDLIILSFGRLIIACALGYVVFLMLKRRNIDVSKFRGIPVKSLATFLTVIVALLGSFILIQDKPIFLRNLTGTSEYPVLGLIDGEFPQPLSQVLGLKQNPIIDAINPVYESIKAFREESGNNNLISSKYKIRDSDSGTYLSYSLNNKNSTRTETLHGRKSGKKVDFRQTQSDFERDTVSYQGERQAFSYSSVKSSLMLSSDDATWTAPLVLPNRLPYAQPGLSDYVFLQYPKLSNIDYLSKPDSHVKNDWIEHIVQANPNVRGFLGFIHGYAKNIPFEKENILNLLIRGCDIRLVKSLTPTPYVRFIDIRNNSLSTVRIESIKKQVLQKDKYELTPVSDRNLLFQSIIAKDDQISISIHPGQNIFIPIEFGFDTRGMKKYFSTEASDADKTKLIEETSTQSSFFGTLAEISNNKLVQKTRNELISILFRPVKLEAEFIRATKSRKLLDSEIPDRFSVGSLLNIKSIRIDGKDISADNPNNDPRFSMSIDFAYGSCPYLMVYDSEKDYWKELGTVITGRNNFSLKGSEVHLLGDNSTKFRIEERDNEITYLDSLSLLYEDANNQVHETALSIPVLDRLDQKYYVLHQGEFLNIDVKRFLPIGSRNVRLKVDGYYQILDPSKMI